ncbi:MAG TPA: hypothetical protein VK762_02305 [Polyangiaceae bacterium]|nr:hypothetical protein [Polyangiaceae bacterium]
MHVPPSLKLLAGMWLAALMGAVAGRSLAEVSSAPARGGAVSPAAPAAAQLGAR